MIEMRSLDVLKDVGIFDLLYFDYLVQKAKVSKRRKANFTPTKKIGGRKHWVNRSGRYKDSDLRRGPKFYHTRKPVRFYKSIRSYGDLITAMRSVALGLSNHDHYTNVDGLGRERLRTVQSLRDRGVDYSVSEIARAGYADLQLISQR